MDATRQAALEIRDLRLVGAIATEGSLARASLRLHLTPSALSHHLLALEARLGQRLCHRAGRRLRLTPAGARLAEAGARVLEALADAERAVAAVEPARDVVRLSTACHTTYYWLPSVIAAYARTNPTVDVRLSAEGGSQHVADLVAGGVDVAIVSDRARDRRVRYLPIFRDELVALVGIEHPWARRQHVAVADFAGEHLIHYASTKSELSIFKQVLRPAGVHPKRTSAVLLTEAILEMVRSGLGIAVLAHWAAAPYLERRQVRAVRITARGLQRQWYAAMRAPAADTAAIRNLVEALRAPGVFKTRLKK
jgi:LysR family transcriptional regulator for metE and metH